MYVFEINVVKRMPPENEIKEHKNLQNIWTKKEHLSKTTYVSTLK